MSYIETNGPTSLRSQSCHSEVLVMPRLVLNTTTEVVKLSYWVFVVWWIIILGVHVITGVYTALYSYCYWVLKDTYLNNFLLSFNIGVPSSYHHTVAIVHAVMAALHAMCILLMVGGSMWQRSLVFTPWSSCDASVKSEESKTDRTSSLVMQSFTKAYTVISDRHGICGVNGVHFHALLIIREVIETALQTIQAYRMSMLLPRILLNRFYVILIVVNCWSSVVVYSSLFKGDEARRRFACIVLDCALDLVSCMGVEIMVLLSYTSDYVVEIRGFWDFTWHNDEWLAQALNEFQMVVVISWSDLASRAIFSLGLIMTTTNMKELLQKLPRNGHRIADSTTGSKLETVKETKKLNVILPNDPGSMVQPYDNFTKQRLLDRVYDSDRDSKLRTRVGKVLLRAAHLVFGAWGIIVLGLHIYASVQPSLPQCLMQVRPWATSRPSCYLVGLDCHALGISGKMDEVEEKWSEFDSSTVVQLLIKHCPMLEIPDSVSEFHGLHGVKVYNSTIVNWGDSAAFTNTNHPEMVSLYVVRVNMSGGLLPGGFQSMDFPKNLYDIEFCVTNLRKLPDELDMKWQMGAILEFEYGQFTEVPSVLIRLVPMYLSVIGNPITEIPPESFEIAGLVQLGIGATKVDELPRNVIHVAPGLALVDIGNTNISFFWSWVDELIGTVWIAPGSTYCDDFAKLENGSADTFSISPSPEYSTILMDPSQENRPNIVNAVICYYFDPTMYPLMIDDYYLAISTPPELVKP